MNFEELAWLFAAAVTLHNLEEAIWLPAWSKKGRSLRKPVEARVFRFAVAALTILLYVCTSLATTGIPLGPYLLCAFALAMAFNAFIPHLAATIVLRNYAPGTATALLLNLPTSMILLGSAVAEGRIDVSLLAWTGPLTALALALSIPLLFRIARMFGRGRQ
jgi:hypothetical protein